MLNYKTRKIAALAASAAIMLSSVEAFARCLEGIDIEAHRGAHGHIENTVDSIIAAVGPDSLYSGVEIDTRMINDDKVILHHDAIPGRVVMNIHAKPVSLMSASEWMNARLGDDQSKRPNFLDEGLVAFRDHSQGKQYINIEVKDKGWANCYNSDINYKIVSSILNKGEYTWSTPHARIANCLARFDDSTYIGFVVAPTEEELVASNETLVDNIDHLSKGRINGTIKDVLVDNARSIYNNSTKNKNFLDDDQTASLLRNLSGRGGLHLSAATVNYHFDRLLEIQNYPLAIGVYSNGDDYDLARAIRDFRSRGLNVSIAIIDGPPEEFCNMF